MNIELIIERELNRQTLALKEESHYIGSCVDVGTSEKPVCDYFADATELSNVVDNERRHEQISGEKFFDYVDKRDIPDGALEGETFFYYVTYSPVFGQSLGLEEAGLFYLYNWDKDIHYFFEV